MGGDSGAAVMRQIIIMGLAGETSSVCEAREARALKMATYSRAGAYLGAAEYREANDALVNAGGARREQLLDKLIQLSSTAKSNVVLADGRSVPGSGSCANPVGSIVECAASTTDALWIVGR